MGLYADAEHAWVTHREALQAELRAPGGWADRGVAALRQVLGGRAVRWRDAVPWAVLGDPFWFDKVVLELVEDGEPPCWVVVDHSQAGTDGAVLLRLVGTCPRCERTAVLDSPVSDLAGLWHARRYGTPVHHRRCPQVVEVDVLPALRAHPADQRLLAR